MSRERRALAARAGTVTAALLIACATAVAGCGGLSTPAARGPSTSSAYVSVAAAGKSGLVLGASGCGVTADLVLTSFKSPHAAGWCGADQRWLLRPLAHGFDSIHADYGGQARCIGLAGARSTVGAALQVRPCNPASPSTSQQFRRPETTGDPHLRGSFYLIPRGSRLCLSAAALGGRIVLRPCGSGRASAWSIPAAPGHTETWAYDDTFGTACNGGQGASTALVRAWLTYAETNCGPNSTKALRDCHAANATYCTVFQYLDASKVWSGNPILRAPWTESWWLHQPGYTDFAHRLRDSSPAYGTGYWLNQANPAAENWVAAYVRLHYNGWDGLMLDSTAASLSAQLYRNASATGQQYTSSQELASNAALINAHERLAQALTHADGAWFTQVDNGVDASPYLRNTLPLLDHPPAVVGLLSEGQPWDHGFSPHYSTLLDLLGYVAHRTGNFIVLLSYDQYGPLQARRVQEATVLLGYQPGHVVSWANLEQNNLHLSVWPEQGIYPTKPVQSMAMPGGPGCLAGGGAVCSRAGHNDLRVAAGSSPTDAAAGVYRREFRACYNRGAWFGRCAVLVNDTAGAVVVRRSWLKQTYSHVIAMRGGDVQSGGMIETTGGRFTPGKTSIAPHDALLVSQ